MSRQLHITRGESELGTLTEAEALELLRAGFLLPTDLFRAEGMTEWRLLAELKLEPAGRTSPAALMKLAKQTVASASGEAVSRAARLAGKLKSVAGGTKTQLAESTNRMLDSFTPQIQKLVSRQLVERSVTRVQAAVHDDEFMRKVFGAVYDCLPKPVYRFVSERSFLEYCMERRQKLLGLPAPGKASDTTPLPSQLPTESDFSPGI